MSVRETCADWIRGIEPHDDPALKGRILTLIRRRVVNFLALFMKIFKY